MQLPVNHENVVVITHKPVKCSENITFIRVFWVAYHPTHARMIINVAWRS